jgi:hypothetical protein
MWTWTATPSPFLKRKVVLYKCPTPYVPTYFTEDFGIQVHMKLPLTLGGVSCTGECDPVLKIHVPKLNELRGFTEYNILRSDEG